MSLLRELDRRQVAVRDGHRSLKEWVAGRMDVAPETAGMLVSTAWRLEDLPDVDEAVAERAAWVTPRLGGVGVTTVAMLLRNAVGLAERQGERGPTLA